MSEKQRHSLLFALLGLLFFVPFLGGVHLFDWDEVNFAEISREMLITGDYTRVYVNFEPFWEKPPFYFWLQALAMYLFGVGEFAARLPNALCGVLTLVLLYRIGRRMYHARFGLLWAGAYFGSVLPFLYFKSGIIDPWFNLFIFVGLYYFVLAYWKRDHVEGTMALSKNAWWYLFLGGFFIGMGILTKGPVAYLIACLTMGVYWIYQRFRFYVTIPQFLFFSLAASIVTLTWFGLETAKNGPWFIQEFTAYQYRLFSTPDAGHKGFPGYHFAVLLVGCFPASIFAIRSFLGLPPQANAQQADFTRWMKYLFWTVLILFTIVESKIVHYSSMCYFPLTFLAALSMDHLLSGRIAYARWMRVGIGILGGLYILATVALPFLGMHTDWLKPLFNDPFAVANLDANVRWTGLEVIPGLLLATALGLHYFWVKRKGPARSMAALLGGTAVFVFATLIFFVKRIEGYSQRANIEFFETHANETVYFRTLNYKSYAHLFYGKVQPGHERASDTDWLLEGEIDRDAYFSVKIHRAAPYRQREELEELYSKNGFVFFRRKARR